MSARYEITRPRKRHVKRHIIEPGVRKPYCDAEMTANTQMVDYKELMEMERDGKVCNRCFMKIWIGYG